MAEDTVEYWQTAYVDDDMAGEGVPVEDGPWHWHIRFANGRIAGHEYSTRADAVEGFHAANAAVFDIMTRLVRQVNQDNGWLDADGVRRHADGTERTIGDEVALLHSEVSELFEEYRDGRIGRYYEQKDGDETVIVPLASHAYPQGKKPIGIPSECADILVRLLDFCDSQGIDLYREWHAKVLFNSTRGHRHGGKVV